MLLAAISATSPCGEDLEYDADFLHLERSAQGQPERSMGDSILPAEPPEWRGIQQQSLDLLSRSKDLRITHFLLQSTLALEGLPGLATSLELIDGLLRDYWEQLHPRLDADDDNDPTVRINALAGLASDTTIGLLRDAILTRSRTFGPVSVRAALNAAGLQHFSGESLGSDHLAGALQDSDPEHLDAIRHALSSARSAVESIEKQVSEQVGSASGVDLSALKQPLRLALQVLGQHAPQAADSPAEAEVEPAPGQEPSAPHGAGPAPGFGGDQQPRRRAAQPRPAAGLLQPPRAFEPVAGVAQPGQEPGQRRLRGHRAQSDPRRHVPI
ncbi:hypothetical protein P308_32420 [Pseudomonas piscis]|nr:hypothetical protein P308_32420 [Pseudomonas piscis]